MIVTNTYLYKTIYFKQVKSTLLKIGLIVNEIILPDGEQYKTVTILNTIFTALLVNNHPRSTTLIALGGGVIGDITGFAASCYQRGVRYIQIPTTLLSQIDSAIGGKTAVNHPLGKNMIGAFYQPISVIIDLNSLITLPTRQFSSGLAEIIKYGITLDYDFFCWLEKNINKLLSLDKKTIIYCIRYCCELKAKIVALDEREIKGQRILLNLGHTFGHAIETVLGYGSWLHGEAVAVGIVMAAKTAELIGQLNKYDTQRIIKLLKHANLPIEGPSGLEPTILFVNMTKDKKVFNSNKINLVLPKSIGKAIVCDNISQKIILDAIKQSISKS